MKIAVPVNGNDQVDEHFGHCESYKIYSISENKSIEELSTIKSPQGCGCKSDIASILANNGVKIMLAGGIGSGAIHVLNSFDIEVIRGCSGDATEVVKQYVSGLIQDNGVSCLQHEHHHEPGHSHICNH